MSFLWSIAYVINAAFAAYDVANGNYGSAVWCGLVCLWIIQEGHQQYENNNSRKFGLQ